LQARGAAQSETTPKAPRGRAAAASRHAQARRRGRRRRALTALRARLTGSVCLDHDVVGGDGAGGGVAELAAHQRLQALKSLCAGWPGGHPVLVCAWSGAERGEVLVCARQTDLPLTGRHGTALPLVPFAWFISTQHPAAAPASSSRPSTQLSCTPKVTHPLQHLCTHRPSSACTPQQPTPAGPPPPGNASLHPITNARPRAPFSRATWAAHPRACPAGPAPRPAALPRG
jgi:hypothetical protein